MVKMSGDNASPEPRIPSSSGGGRRKYYAVITVLIMVAASLAVIDMYKGTPHENPQILGAGSTSSTSSVYNFTVITNGRFVNATYYFGDGTSQTINYTGVNGMSVAHHYGVAGKYYIFYRVNYGSWTYTNSGSLIQVAVSNPHVTPTESMGFVEPSSGSVSASTSSGGGQVYPPGSNLSLVVGYYTPPSNGIFQVYRQSVNVTGMNGKVGSGAFPYTFNRSSGTFTLSRAQSEYSFAPGSNGVYEVNLSTFTTGVNSTTGALNSTSGVYRTSYIYDVPVFRNGGIYSGNSQRTVFVNARLQNGGYYSLDPAVQYDVVSESIDMNTMQTLVFYNGSSDSSYKPYLASELPSVSNGGINTGYSNYSVHATKAEAGYNATYTVHVKPYENYTFHIRKNATWQNGQPVTAWDVKYSLARLLLFENGSPGTSGFLFAQYFLPEPYYQTASYWNITRNITVDNNTNSLTIHYQSPMSSSLVYDSLTYAWITDSSWLKAHGAGITWTPQGFRKYEAQGNANDYNTYVQNHVFSDGPYKISYIEPSSKVILVRNPDFNPPGPWYRKPSISSITIQYLDNPTNVYLEMKSGLAQTGNVPSSSWISAEKLNSTGQFSIYNFPSTTINFYSFNAHVNTTGLKDNIVPQANLPSSLFTSLNARKAFAYSFDYGAYFASQVGNTIYNTTFRTPYAGVLPKGLSLSESIARLNASTGGRVPYFSLSVARHYWSAFANGTGGSRAHITYSGGRFLYNGNPLDIPIFALDTNPSNVESASTWATGLQKIIPGIQVQIVKITQGQLNGYLVAGNNDLPIYDWSTTPTFPYPTYNLITNALPESTAYYPGVNSMIPSWFSSPSNALQNATQAGTLSRMVSMYNNGTGNYSHPQAASKWFRMMNSEVVNMTMYVYTGQTYYHLVISSKVSPKSVREYEENPLLGGAGIMMYNMLSYRSS